MKQSLALALLVCAPFLNASSVLKFTNGQAAKATFGQVSFSYEGTTPSGQVVGGVSGIAWANGTLYVADGNLIGGAPIGNRVVVFPTDYPEIRDPRAVPTNPAGDTACALCGYQASAALGQIDLGSTVPGIAATPSSNAAGSLSNPTAVATDGTLFAIADTRNNRVLIWNTVPSSATVPPNVVLGQPDFTTRQAASNTPSASSLITPQGVWFQNGKLFVVDTGNSRVLIWNQIPTSNNQAADLVLGQANFQSDFVPPLSNTSPPTAANLLLNPISVSSDGTRLFVADFGYNRVLIWNNIPTQNDQPADVVIGQADLTRAIPNNTSVLCAPNGKDSNNNPTYPGDCAKTLDHPRAVLSDGVRLFVADSGNDRVLIYNQIPTSNTAAADLVLGQPDFTSNVVSNQTGSTISTTIDNTGSVDTTPTPMGLAFDGTNLYVSDALNRRVLVFAPGDISLGETNIKNTASKITQAEGFVTLTDTSIVANDTVTITIQGTAYTYKIVSGDTLDTITTKLIGTINGTVGGGTADPNVVAHVGAIANTVFLSSKASNVGFDAISLAATTSNTAHIVATASGGYLVGGNSGTAAPGTLVEIDDPNLDANGNVINGLELSDFTASANLQGPVPVILTAPNSQASVQVFMDGRAAPVISVSPAQVIAQVPFEYTDRNSTSIFVRRVHADGTVSVTIASPLVLAPASPGLFSIPGTASARPAFRAMHQAGNPSATISIDGTIQAGDSVQVSVSGRNYSYTVQASDSLVKIAAALVAAVNNGNDPQVTAQQGGAFARVVLVARQAGAAGTGIGVSGTVTAASGKSSATETATAYTSSTCCATSGTGQVTVGNPAKANEIITFMATGLGLVQDANGNAIPVTTGAPYTGTQPNSAVNTVNATVSGSTGQVISAGLAPGGIGVYGIQILMPSTLPSSGVAAVYIAQNAFISNTVTIPVGAPGISPVSLNIDIPSPQSSNLGGIISVAGWAIDTNAAIATVEIDVDGNFVGNATYGLSRPDVCNAYPSSFTCAAGSTAVGWSFQLNTILIPRGSHTISVIATSTDSQQNTATRVISLTNPVKVYIDAPQPGTSISGTNVSMTGWAISNGAPITGVTVSVDQGPAVNASYGGLRPDVCAAFPAAKGCPAANVGWNFLYPSNLANGSHILTVTATDANGSHGVISSTFTVAGVASGTVMYIDNPQTNSPVSGTSTFQGWAASSNSPLATVSISIDGVPQPGNAVIGPRADVCAAYPASAGCPNVGWTFPVDTTLLANGTHTVTVTATTAAGLPSTTASAFTVANHAGDGPLRVYIDVPNSQTAVSGTTDLTGWALSDSTPVTQVRLAIDGVSLSAPAVLGGSRPDVCAAFPGRPGCPNVGWTSQFDSTTLPDGIHTLSATAMANDQIATVSRPFSVANQSTSQIIAYIDRPGQTPLSGPTQFVGWAVGKNAAISTVSILVDGVPYGTANYGTSRPDVCAVYPTSFACSNGNGNVGWTFTFDPSTLGPGTHTLDVTSSAGGQNGTISKSFTVVAPSSGILVNADNPNGAGSTFVGEALLSGWAISNTAPVTSVVLSIDGVPYASGTSQALQINGVTYTPATYGLYRPDVCAAYPQAVCPNGNVGWNLLLDTASLDDGSHVLDVTATAGGQHSTISTSFTVANMTSTNPVRIYFDVPNGRSAPLNGSVTLQGWAISDDGPVTQLSISIDGSSPQPLAYGEPRPDVCKVYPGRSGCPNVGWSFTLDTTLLADGVHTVSITATTLGQNATVSTSFSVSNFGQ